MQKDFSSAKPCIRQVEPVPFTHNGQQVVHLRDPHRFVENGLAVSIPAYWLITMMDGGSSVEEIRSVFNEKNNSKVTSQEIETLVKTLDENYMLDNERFADYKNKIIREFQSQTVRKSVLCGTSYPDDATELSNLLETYLASGNSGSDVKPDILIAPHIDLSAGGPSFGAAYAPLRGSDAESFVILGTGHTLSDDFFACIDKDFETPLGTSELDRVFLVQLEKEFGEPIYKNAYAHRFEHSVEFQVLFLQKLFGNANPQKKIVPILLSFPETVDDMDHPIFNSERIEKFSSALQKTIDAGDGKICLIGGIDLSHIGKRFGQVSGANSERLKKLESEDRQALQHIADGKKKEFVEYMKKVNPQNNICGFPVLYVMMDLLNGRKGKLLDYRQNVEGDNESAVSFAAMTFS